MLVTREVDEQQARVLRGSWDTLQIALRAKILGLLIGLRVTPEEVWESVCERLTSRIGCIQEGHMSMAARVLSSNVFLLTLFSYIGRVLLAPEAVRSRVAREIRSFVLPVPVVKLSLLAHMQSIFGISVCAQDLFFVNVAGVLATATRLLRSGFAFLQGEDGFQEVTAGGHPMRMCRHIARAFVIFREATGTTVAATLGQSGRGTERDIQRQLYSALLSADRSKALDYAWGRWAARGLNSEAVSRNLARFPRSVPQAHRWAMWQVLFNAVPTARRYRFFREEPVSVCCFCNAGEDSLEHLCNCAVVGRAYTSVLTATGVAGGSPWGRGVMFLQETMDGEQCRTVAAVVHAVLRCRSFLIRGLSFGSTERVVEHVLQLVQHPWIACASRTNTRAQRSLLRGRCPPPEFTGAVVYRSDGAARGQGRGGTRTGSASFGAVRLMDGVVVGRCGMVVGDATNNVAEYMGMLASVRDACNRLQARREPNHCVFQLDSMLVTKQGNFLWRCLSDDLAPYYEQVIEGIRSLERDGVQVTVMHIYREFNTLADGLANEVLDIRRDIVEDWVLNRA